MDVSSLYTVSQRIVSHRTLSASGKSLPGHYPLVDTVPPDTIRDSDSSRVADSVTRKKVRR